MADEKPKPAPVVYEEPSEHFLQAFGGYGTNAAKCDFCGVTYFGICTSYDADPDADGEAELAYWRQQQEKEPEKYVEWVCDGVSYSNIAGRNYVHGCPCNRVRPYEDFIWDNQAEILGYLRARLCAEQEATEQKLASLSVVEFVKERIAIHRED